MTILTDLPVVERQEPIAPLLSGRGALAALLAAIVLCWPMLAVDGYLAYFDTKAYLAQGRTALTRLADALDLFSQTGQETAPPMEASAKSRTIRSPLYPLYTVVAGGLLWPAVFAIVQAALTIWTVLALVPLQALDRPRLLLAGIAGVFSVTSLPWFTSYLMPDILAAAVIAYAAILLRLYDRLGWQQRVALTAIASFAVAAHYGHVPLAVVLFGGVWFWRLVRGRITMQVTVAALLPVLFAPLFNLTASTAAFDTPSVAPLRLPILLARSIEDGPARWYLQEACPEAPLAFCKAFGDDVPENISQFLWNGDGIESLSRDEMARIRSEEHLILWRAFRAYPAAQTTSLVSNAALQLVKIGTGEFVIADRRPDGTLALAPGDPRERVLETFDQIVPWGTWILALPVVWLALRGRLDRREIEILVVVISGLVVNAAIFGGLSAPVDRYQSRVVWLLPTLSVIFLASRRVGPQPSRSRK